MGCTRAGADGNPCAPVPRRRSTGARVELHGILFAQVRRPLPADCARHLGITTRVGDIQIQQARERPQTGKPSSVGAPAKRTRKQHAVDFMPRQLPLCKTMSSSDWSKGALLRTGQPTEPATGQVLSSRREGPRPSKVQVMSGCAPGPPGGLAVAR